ncbi:hypothetical protein PV327_009745 [Microctonus hyperodae]|uniref:Flavin-containing monooxygenase n=1 Tax=Microctonus hyperodae TaxID=165561 RepID=A0AA39CB48_MICHY|nr:hypothetical protein PV327_009745 [Microctonus hyperodae]
MAAITSRKKIRICVIGAGAAGLCAARHLSRDLEKFEAAVFEQDATIGGTWIYNDNISIDNNNYPIHTSMYKNLRTNIPLKLMNFPDFQLMDQKRPSCGTHEQVLNYLHDYANHFQLLQYIQFNTKIQSIKPQMNSENWQQTTFKVTIEHLNTQIIEDQIFDAIIICNGHFSTPKIPVIIGIETFSGDSMHSHDYRTPEKYENKIVIILGAGFSGIDIGVEISDYAQHVYLSHNNSRLITVLPLNMTEVQGIESINGNNFILNDGTIIIADALIYCTGYHITLPFLTDECRIKVIDNRVTPLYKHLINIEHPKMAIIGLPSHSIPFPLFHYQVQYFLGLLLNRVNLPSKDKMLEDDNLNGGKYPHKLGQNQWDYNNYFANAVGVDKLPIFYEIGYNAVYSIRLTNVLQYKDTEFIVEDDGETVHVNI